MVIYYTHPTEGYGADNASHPDLVKNPNKQAPRRDELFRLALPFINYSHYDYIVRAALDDDDFWLPWQVSEILGAAECGFENDTVVGIGLSRTIVAYIHEGKLDIADMQRYMTGNKFWVSPITELEKITHLSPWSIPEKFDRDEVARFQRVGVKLKISTTNRPGWVYGRWGTNLSNQGKSYYYGQLYTSEHFSTADQLIEIAEKSVENLQELNNNPVEIIDLSNGS